MKRVVIAVVAALSLVLPVSAFAIEGSQPPKETALLSADYTPGY